MFTLEGFIAKAKENNIGVDAVMAIQDDAILGLHRFNGPIKHDVFSVAKTFTVSGIGAAIDEGLMTLDDKPTEYFKDILPADLDERWYDVTLENLITMCSGHAKPHFMVVDRVRLRGQKDPFPEDIMAEWLKFAFGCPMVYNAGEKFNYGNLAPYVAGRMLEKATGMTVLDWVYNKIWQPLGVEKPSWDTDNSGHTFPASDLLLDITDMIKIGQIYLGGGEYKGHRYLSKEWVENATRKHVDSAVINPGGYGIDEEAGYGFYIWMNHIEGSYRAYGREGQFVIVIPDKNAVIATQSMHHDVQQILDLVWEHIYPQL